MNAQSIVDDLQNSGIRFTVVGDKLRLKADAEIPPAAIETVKKHKAEIIHLLQKEKKPTRAKGYGCAGCGNKIYQAIQAWEMSQLPAAAGFGYEHKLAIAWKCEGCRAVFQYIGGSKGPQLIC